MNNPYLQPLDDLLKDCIQELNKEIKGYTEGKTKSRVIPYYQHAKGKLEAFMEIRIKIKELNNQ